MRSRRGCGGKCGRSRPAGAGERGGWWQSRRRTPRTLQSPSTRDQLGGLGCGVGVIEIAGRQHHAMPSQIEVWASMAQLRLRSHRVLLQDEIEGLRTILRDPGSGEPRITVNSRCRALIREFGSYRYHESREHHPVSEVPIDADNHAIKALCYWLYDRFGEVRPRGLRKSIPFRITW